MQIDNISQWVRDNLGLELIHNIGWRGIVIGENFGPRKRIVLKSIGPWGAAWPATDKATMIIHLPINTGEKYWQSNPEGLDIVQNLQDIGIGKSDLIKKIFDTMTGPVIRDKNNFICTSCGRFHEKNYKGAYSMECKFSDCRCYSP